MEGDTDAKTTEGRIGGAEEEGGGIARALVVATPALSKGVAVVDEGALTGSSEATRALTSVAGEAEISWVDVAGGGGA